MSNIKKTILITVLLIICTIVLILIYILSNKYSISNIATNNNVTKEEVQLQDKNLADFISNFNSFHFNSTLGFKLVTEYREPGDEEKQTNLTDTAFNSSTDPKSRLKAAKEASNMYDEFNNKINLSAQYFTKADDLLVDLKKSAASIQDQKIRVIALEIAELSEKEYNEEASYKVAQWQKFTIISDMLQMIIEDNGRLDKLTAYSNREGVEQSMQRIEASLNESAIKYNEVSKKKLEAYSNLQELIK